MNSKKTLSLAQIVLRHTISRCLNLTLIESDKTQIHLQIFFPPRLICAAEWGKARAPCFQLLVFRRFPLFKQGATGKISNIFLYVRAHLNESIKFYGDAAKVAQRGEFFFYVGISARHEFFHRTFRRELATRKVPMEAHFLTVDFASELSHSWRFIMNNGFCIAFVALRNWRSQRKNLS
jgi:hypothetical protein